MASSLVSGVLRHTIWRGASLPGLARGRIAPIACPWCVSAAQAVVGVCLPKTEGGDHLRQPPQSDDALRTVQEKKRNDDQSYFTLAGCRFISGKFCSCLGMGCHVLGGFLTFSASGAVSNGPCCPLVELDGGGTQGHRTGAENGIADTVAPINALVGVFLDTRACLQTLVWSSLAPSRSLGPALCRGPAAGRCGRPARLGPALCRWPAWARPPACRWRKGARRPRRSAAAKAGSARKSTSAPKVGASS